jgi:hypothetical protein
MCRRAKGKLTPPLRETEREIESVTFNLGKVCENVTERMVKRGWRGAEESLRERVDGG